MSAIRKIEYAACRYYESGLECPDFVFVSADIYNDLLKEAMQMPNPYAFQGRGFTTFSVWTSVGQLTVKVCSSWPDDSIIIGDHPIFTILQKLGDII